MLNTLSYIGENLNRHDIKWAVGGSILLNQFGLVDNPNDIDLFVDLNDIDRVDSILKDIGIRKLNEKSKTYSTKFFYEYIVNEVDVDVMAGFSINHDKGVFEYVFDNHSITKVVNINGIDIPLTSLEDWYVIYQLIPNRELKVKIIEEYLLTNGTKNSYLLERALKGSLPNEVRIRTEKLIIKKEEDDMQVMNLEESGSSEILRIILKSLIVKKGYNKAENILFEEIEKNKSEQNYKVGLDFYEELLEKSDEELVESNFSREEVLQGLKDLELLFKKN